MAKIPQTSERATVVSLDAFVLSIEVERFGALFIGHSRRDYRLSLCRLRIGRIDTDKTPDPSALNRAARTGKSYA